VWTRAIGKTEHELREMNRLVSEKISHQRRLIAKLQNYIRVRDNNVSQRAAASFDTCGSSSSSSSGGGGKVVEDDGEQHDQNALSAQLSANVSSLKAMTSESVQVLQ